MKLEPQSLITFNKIEDKKLFINAKKMTLRQLKEYIEIESMMGNIDPKTIALKYHPNESKLILIYK